jgi:Mu-like prophage I protein
MAHSTGRIHEIMAERRCGVAEAQVIASTPEETQPNSFCGDVVRLARERGITVREAQFEVSARTGRPAPAPPVSATPGVGAESFTALSRRIMSEHGCSLERAYDVAARILRGEIPRAEPSVLLLRGDPIQLPDSHPIETTAPVWCQLAIQGRWLGHPAGPFEMNKETFEEIITNFRATKNRAIPFDLEHASEADPTAGSIPVTGAPAQGWITDLKIEAGSLWGLVDWLEPARTYIREGRYKFVSPAIRFGSRDRVTGKPVGARLTSVALTNCPFLDGMRPVAASDRSLVAQ